MRWPWQRSDEHAPDAAPRRAATNAAAEAAPRVPPSGWAFLPPLQRQVSDAPPAVLRPSFVASLPTRTVPASLGAMGHLVDERAPGGTIAVDDGAFSAPVQRAIAADLTLRTSPDMRRAPTTRQPQQTTDAAEATPIGEPPAPPSAPSEPSDLSLAPDPPPEVRGSDVVEQAGETSGPLIGGEIGAPISRLVDDSVTPEVSASSGAGARVSASRPPSVRPTLQRLPSTAGATHASDEGAMPRPDASPPVVPPAQRRVGLGAPLPTRSVQRAPSEDLADFARSGSAPSGIDSAPVMRASTFEAPGSDDGPAASAAEAMHADADDAVQREGDEPLQRDIDEALHRDIDESRSAPLLADRPLARAVAPAGGMTQATGGPPLRHGEHAPDEKLAPASSSPLVAPRATGVQRQAEADARSVMHEHPPISELPPANAEALDAASSDAASSAPDPGVGVGGAPPSIVQRSVPLVAARRIVPAITLSAVGSPLAPNRSGRVVVARVVAPLPVSEAGGATSGSEPVPSVPGASSNRAGRRSATVGGANHGKPLPESGGAAADEPWSTTEPAVLASVSRLTVAAPGLAREESRPSTATPVLAGTTTTTSSRRVGDALPAAVQRLAGLPSLRPPSLDMPQLPQAPSGLPSIGEPPASLPSVDQLESRAGEIASGATDALRSGSDALTAPAQAASSALAAAGAENVEQLVRKLYGPLVRRIKAELLLDRERRGIRIDGI